MNKHRYKIAWSKGNVFKIFENLSDLRVWVLAKDLKYMAFFKDDIFVDVSSHDVFVISKTLEDA